MLKNLVVIIVAFLLTLNVNAGNVLQNNKYVKQIKEKYDLELFAGKYSGGSYAKRWAKWNYLSDRDSAAFNEFMIVFAKEWNKYPVSWIIINNLKKIVFVKKLSVTGQYRFAMPDPYDEALYYDIEYLIYGYEYVTESIHHEFWHMIEEQHFGTMYYRSNEWQSFNNSDFSYGDGGSFAYTDGKYVSGEHTVDGFVSNYAMYGEEEDRAELYSWLFTSRTWQLLNGWIENDEILKNKFDWMLNFIESKVPEMNIDYFFTINKTD